VYYLGHFDLILASSGTVSISAVRVKGSGSTVWCDGGVDVVKEGGEKAIEAVRPSVSNHFFYSEKQTSSSWVHWTVSHLLAAKE